MRNLIKILFFLVVVYNQANGQNKSGFELNGYIDGIKNGTSIYLTSIKKDTILSSKIIGSRFTMAGYIEGDANCYFLKIDTTISKQASNALWLVNDKMSLQGSINTWRSLILKGSEPHDEFKEQIALTKGQINSSNILEVKKWISEHNNSLYIADLIIKAQTILYKTPNELSDVYISLTERAKKSFYGVELGKQIARRTASDTMSSLSEIPDFTVTTPDGDIKSIHELVAIGRYTLIDFWASWCGPCRDGVPELKRIYEKFHSSGFNIIGVSIDKSEVAWKKAITEDETTWIHGLDNLENASKAVFGITAIPSYILIDHDGKIVEMDIISSPNMQTIKKTGDRQLRSDLHDIIERLLSEGKK